MIRSGKTKVGRHGQPPLMNPTWPPFSAISIVTAEDSLSGPGTTSGAMKESSRPLITNVGRSILE